MTYATDLLYEFLRVSPALQSLEVMYTVNSVEAVVRHKDNGQEYQINIKPVGEMKEKYLLDRCLP